LLSCAKPLLTRFLVQIIIFVIKKRSEKNTFLILKLISAQSMLVNQELTGQFLLFEDDENPEIPLEESTDDSSEDADEKEEDDDEEDD